MAATTHCPNCHDETGKAIRLEVVTVRHRPDGTTVRCRRCPSCRADFKSEERLTSVRAAAVAVPPAAIASARAPQTAAAAGS
jgi:transcriptional regulator NrdR family protein